MELLKTKVDCDSTMDNVFFVESSVYRKYTSLCDDNYFLDLEGVEKLEIDLNFTEKMHPIEFLKRSLMMERCENSRIIDKLYKFCENSRVINKFKRKNISMMTEGISNNKWNVYVCTLFNFLLGRSFVYRNKKIGESESIYYI